MKSVPDEKTKKSLVVPFSDARRTEASVEGNDHCNQRQ